MYGPKGYTPQTSQAVANVLVYPPELDIVAEESKYILFNNNLIIR